MLIQLLPSSSIKGQDMHQITPSVHGWNAKTGREQHQDSGAGLLGHSHRLHFVKHILAGSMLFCHFLVSTLKRCILSGFAILLLPFPGRVQLRITCSGQRQACSLLAGCRYTYNGSPKIAWLNPLSLTGEDAEIKQLLWVIENLQEELRISNKSFAQAEQQAQERRAVVDKVEVQGFPLSPTMDVNAAKQILPDIHSFLRQLWPKNLHEKLPKIYKSSDQTRDGAVSASLTRRSVD